MTSWFRCKSCLTLDDDVTQKEEHEGLEHRPQALWSFCSWEGVVKGMPLSCYLENTHLCMWESEIESAEYSWLHMPGLSSLCYFCDKNPNCTSTKSNWMSFSIVSGLALSFVDPHLSEVCNQSLCSISLSVTLQLVLLTWIRGGLPKRSRLLMRWFRPSENWKRFNQRGVKEGAKQEKRY